MQAETKPPAKKRQRSENWIEEDKILLKALVRERVRIIENKNTDTNTNNKKVAAWADLQNSFNCMCKGAQRTLTQLKAQWGITKMTAKKQKACERREQTKTGGGPPPSMEPSYSDDVSAWLPNEFVIDTNEFDSDYINQVNKKVDLKVSEPELDVESNNNILTVIIEQDENKSFTDEPGQIPLDEPYIQEAAVHPGASSPTQTSTSAKKKKKLHQTKKSESSTFSAAEKVAANEIQCRMELHRAQLDNEKQRAENEKQKAENLVLKKILLETKIKYYETKVI